MLWLIMSMLHAQTNNDEWLLITLTMMTSTRSAVLEALFAPSLARPKYRPQSNVTVTDLCRCRRRWQAADGRRAPGGRLVLPPTPSLAIFALKLLASIIGDASAYPAGLSPSSPVSSMGHAKLFCGIGPSSLLPSPQKVNNPPAYRRKVLRQCGGWQCPLTIDADAPCGRANLLNTGHVCTFICDPIPISAAPGIATWRETRRRTTLHPSHVHEFGHGPVYPRCIPTTVLAADSPCRPAP